METNDDTAKWSDMFQSMELEGLKEMRKMLDRAIASYETRKRQEALSALEEAAKEHGFKLTDLISNGKPGKGRKSGAEASSVSARYANPENPEQTWSGRGRRPQWVKDALESGRALEDLVA